MKILGIIPARYHSTRLPGKPLVDINGMSMIQRVYSQAKKSRSLSRVIVATEHQLVFEHVKSLGGEVVMTSERHRNGTERCAEALRKAGEDFDYVVNIQGDEPFLKPSQIDELAQLCTAASEEPGHLPVVTLVKRIRFSADLFQPSVVKVIIGKNNSALYFSRSPIPWLRDVPQKDWVKRHSYFKHIGMYGFGSQLLMTLAALPVSGLEKAESLEQLRWLENGYRIVAGFTEHESHSIDTQEDLARIAAK